jgi:SET domain-containing protein
VRGGSSWAQAQAKLTPAERLAQLHSTVHERVTFGKSGVHGWGLMAKRELKAGTMIIEYCGQNVRESVANLREKQYHATKEDCYLLSLDEHFVTDSTRSGNISRFTNHSCNPNMYNWIIEASGRNHTVFFARCSVAAGEELTFDYRMESDDTTMACSCGAPNCRGTIDINVDKV